MIVLGGDDGQLTGTGRRGSISGRWSTVSDRDLFVNASVADDQSMDAVDPVVESVPGQFSPGAEAGPSDIMGSPPPAYQSSRRRSSVLPPLFKKPSPCRRYEHLPLDGAVSSPADADGPVFHFG